MSSKQQQADERNIFICVRTQCLVNRKCFARPAVFLFKTSWTVLGLDCNARDMHSKWAERSEETAVFVTCNRKCTNTVNFWSRVSVKVKMNCRESLYRHWDCPTGERLSGFNLSVMAPRGEELLSQIASADWMSAQSSLSSNSSSLKVPYSIRVFRSLAFNLDSSGAAAHN